MTPEERIERLEQENKTMLAMLRAIEIKQQADELRRINLHLEAHDRSIDALDKMHLRHVEEMAELRVIVHDIGVMLKSFIASIQGGRENGGAK